MELTIQREQLLKPLGLVVGAVERRHTLPILANVLLDMKDGVLTLTGTDLEVEIKARLHGVSGAGGQTTLPARKVLDICRALPAQAKLEIRQDKDKAVIKSGKSRFTLISMPAAEYPSIETTAWTGQVALTQGDLKGLLERTNFCMAQQDVRYYLNGMMLEFSGTRVRAVATDGHRLALAETSALQPVGEERQVIVPRKGVQEMVRFLEDSDEQVQIELSPNHVRLNLNDVVFTSKLIDGRFPDYHKVIPSAQSKVVQVDREALREMLARAAILSNEKYRGIRLAVAPEVLKVTAHNPEQEEAQEELPVDYRGDAMEIGFNVTYLTEAVAALRGEQVELGLSDPDSSGTIRAPGDSKTVYVVMPMRL